jgi:hypothetical protein
MPTRRNSRRVATPAGECQMAWPTSTMGDIKAAQRKPCSTESSSAPIQPP